MKFYDCSTAPSPRRVRIFIAEKGIEIPTVNVDLGAEEQLKGAFAEINPWCTVPVLGLDDGTTISEATAVCRYLEEKFPEPRLMGTTPEERARVAMWDHIVEMDGFFAVAEAFRNSHPRYVGRALTGPVNVEQIPALAERGHERVARFFGMLDKRLGESEYIAGDRFSFADITALVAVDFSRILKTGLADSQSNAKRWHEQVSARPGAVK